MLILGGVALLLVGGVAVWWLARGQPPHTAYRTGPWPGLLPRGAAVLLAAGLLLAGGQALLLLQGPRRAWPDLVVLAILSVVPLALATAVVRAPGSALAVAGTYLLPRSVWSL